MPAALLHAMGYVVLIVTWAMVCVMIITTIVAVIGIRVIAAANLEAQINSSGVPNANACRNFECVHARTHY